MVLLAAGVARADDSMLFSHPADVPWWISGQMNIIGQAYPAFGAAYSGENSLDPGGGAAVSLVATLYTGIRLGDTELFFDLEAAAGGGIGDALGLGGYTNLDVVRNPSLGSTPYIARAFVKHTIGLGGEPVPVERGIHGLASALPARRLEIRAGKLSTVDVFDQNGPGSDSHLGFMNWTADNAGAFDYPADTRGYTLGAIVEYTDGPVSVRYGFLLMPTVANGIDYDFDLGSAHGQVVEVELRLSPSGKPGVYRLLGFWNQANMGSYEESNRTFAAAGLPAPRIEDTRQPGRNKVGFGLNVEQSVSNAVKLFGRLSWNDGKNESFAYTEVDDSLELGAEVTFGWKGLEGQRVGIAGISNGLSSGHREYLRLGGSGFLLGDGGLTYGREWIAEVHYTVPVGHGIAPAIDLQLVANPGYNQDRGPVVVGSLRLHVDF